MCPHLPSFLTTASLKNTIPTEWKCAVIAPLFKKGDKLDLNNYRGISAIPPIAKLFEKSIAKHITAYFENNDLFFEGQHGFRKGLSFESALHEVLSTLNKNQSKRLINLLYFIDFRKAFDTVDADL